MQGGQGFRNLPSERRGVQRRDMPAEPPPEPRTKVRGAPGGEADPAAAGVATERALNSPTPLTLRLLGVIFAATFIPWLGAKTACNLREAPQRTPLELPAAVHARQAKSAALELQQRAATGRFAEAAELARGELREQLLAEAERCRAEPAPCEALRAREERVVTRAVLVRRTASIAEARVETRVGDAPPAATEKVQVRLEAEGGRWYVVERTAFEGDLMQPAEPAGTEAPGHSSVQAPHGVAPGGSNNVPAASSEHSGR